VGQYWHGRVGGAEGGVVTDGYSAGWVVKEDRGPELVIRVMTRD
jgi:hypothetical protein